MKRWLKTVCALIFIFLLPSIDVYAETNAAGESMAEQADEKSGYLTFVDYYSGDTRDVFVKVINGEIYASAEDIAKICGTQVQADTDEGWITFDRNGYRAEINLNNTYTYLSNTAGQISAQTFEIDNDIDQEGNVYLQLERTMYVLNAGWQPDDDKIFVEIPTETFWNTLNEYNTLFMNRPMVYDLTGSGNEAYGNSAKFVLWSLADEIDYKLFIPFVGSWLVERGKTEDAIQALGTEDSASLKNEKEALDYLEDIVTSSKGAAEVGTTFYESMGSVSEAIDTIGQWPQKPFNSWENIQDARVIQTMAKLKEFQSLSDAAKYIEGAFEVIAGYSRAVQWSDSYLGQMLALSQADTGRFTEGKDKADEITDIAGDVYENSQQLGVMVFGDAIFQMADMVFNEIFELTPVGRVVNIYNAAIEVAGTISPEIGAGLEMGDNAYETKMMINISTVATYDCSDKLTALTKQKEITLEDIKTARDSYMLMARSYFRAWNDMIKVKDQEGYSSQEEKEELARLEALSYALTVRINESAKYDHTLLLQEDFGNLYNDDMEKGGIREKIPLEMIAEKFEPASDHTVGNVVLAEDGTVYYWQYHAESFESSGTSVNYEPLQGAVNTLMSRSPEGEISAAAELEGSGTLALADHMIFYEQPADDEGNMNICVYDLETGETESICEGRIKAVAGQKIIFTNREENQIGTISPQSKAVNKLADGNFLTNRGEFVYYQPPESDKALATQGQTTLSVISSDGTGQKNLCTTAPDLYPESTYGTAEIIRMVFKDDFIYFSYGSYAGSEQEFEGGRIMCVKDDGTQAQVAAGTDRLQEAVFTVEDDGTVSSTDFSAEPKVTIYPMNDHYTQDGSVYFFDEHGSTEALIDQGDYASIADVQLDYWQMNEMLGLKFAEKIGDSVYFMVDYGTVDAAASSGRFFQYKREKSALLCKNIMSGETETIYTF